MDAASHPLQLSPGLPDSAFTTDGLLTKRILRAYALAMLAPIGDELLWDLGAGTGSVAIEWCRAHPGNRALAVERNAERAARIIGNAEQLGVGGRVEVLTAPIEDTVDTLAARHDRPGAIFVGGGVTVGTLRHAWGALGASGRLVAHSVTAESDAVLLDAYRRWGGDLVRVGVETAEPLGRYTGFVPARTVTAWAARRADDLATP